MMSNTVLEIKNLTRCFGTFMAVDAVTLSVNADEGKTTTIKMTGSPSTFGLSCDYAVMLLTTTVLVLICARMYPRLAT